MRLFEFLGQTGDIYGGLRGVRLARLYGGDCGGRPAIAAAGAGNGTGASRRRPYAHTRRAAAGDALAHGGGNRAGSGNGGIGR